LQEMKVSARFNGSSAAHGYFKWTLQAQPKVAQPLPACAPDMASLYVLVPDGVPVTIDGATSGVGPISITITPGQHTVSVPEIVSKDDNTRLKFLSWQTQNPAIGPDFEIHVASKEDLQLEAMFIDQYRLNLVSSNANVTSEWYDSDSTARFYITNTVLPMPGLLGFMGGKMRFIGWYENGALVTSSSYGTILMGKPHDLSAKWQDDYTMPADEAAVLAIASVAILLTFARRNQSRSKKLPPRLVQDEISPQRKKPDYLVKLEQLHSSGQIADVTYEKLKKEYESD
jgi:hypothetical protein